MTTSLPIIFIKQKLVVIKNVFEYSNRIVGKGGLEAAHKGKGIGTGGIMRKFAVLGLTLIVLLSLTAKASALTITVYTNKAVWEAALSGQFLTENFDDAYLNVGVSFISSESAHLNPSLGYYQDVLASGSANTPSTTWSFTPSIIAYGGNWTLGGPGGSGNSLLVYINDSYKVGGISNYYGEFWGFISDTPFTSVKLIGASGGQQQHYNLDDMVYSQVPVPGTLWLLSGGLMGLLALRRQFL